MSHNRFALKTLGAACALALAPMSTTAFAQTSANNLEQRADRLENKADRIENQADKKAEQVKDRMEQRADRLENKADKLEDRADQRADRREERNERMERRAEQRSEPMGERASGAAATTGAAAAGAGATAAGTADANVKVGQSEMKDLVDQITNSTKIVKQMESDPQVKNLMQQAKGIFLVPQYGRGGLGIGVRGGEGVLLVNNGGKWSNPVFYNIGGVSIGAQAGAEIGQMAMLLMNEKAVKGFMQENNFSMTASAGLTIVDYTAKASAGTGRGDVIVWSDTKGAFANASVGVVDITFDDDENRMFYNDKVSAKQIIAGQAKPAANAKMAQQLTQALPSGGASGGSTGSGSSAGVSGSASSDTKTSK